MRNVGVTGSWDLSLAPSRVSQTKEMLQTLNSDKSSWGLQNPNADSVIGWGQRRSGREEVGGSMRNIELPGPASPCLRLFIESLLNESFRFAKRSPGSEARASTHEASMTKCHQPVFAASGSLAKFAMDPISSSTKQISRGS